MTPEVKHRSATNGSLVQIRDNDFRVHSSVYTDPEVFELEMRAIFEGSWIYLAHENEIPQPGDFRTGRMGRQPIIITRGEDDSINVLINSCRHRANAVCREERGNAMSFRCPYHAWVYTNKGQLIGVADRPRYSEDFDAAEYSLVKVPRVDSYRGLIFASLSEDVPSLSEHLGMTKKYIDLWADKNLEGGPIVPRPHRYGYEGNWKFQAENGVDGYHPGIVHESAFAAFAASGIRAFADRRPIDSEHVTRGFPGGHCTLEGAPESGRGTAKSLPEEHNDYIARLVAAHGEERARDITANRHLFIFPNMFLFDDLIRVIQPISPEKTEVYSNTFTLGGVSPEFNARRFYEAQRQLSTSGLVNPSDLEMFASNQTGLQGGRMEWLLLSRGMDREKVLVTGERNGVYSDEVPQRSFYRHWAQTMNQTVGA
jgi:benzoate/toluate 1,2-dioxygenase alpha subunit